MHQNDQNSKTFIGEAILLVVFPGHGPPRLPCERCGVTAPTKRCTMTPTKSHWKERRRERERTLLKKLQAMQTSIHTGKKAPSLGAIAAAIQQEKNCFYVTALIDHQFEIDSGPNMRGPFYFSTKVPSHIHHTSLLRIPDY